MDGVEQEIETWQVVVDADLRGLRQEMKLAADLGRDFSRSLVGAFEGVAVKGKSLQDVFKGLALDLSRMVLKSAFKPLEQGLGSVLGGLFSGGLGGVGGASGVASVAPSLPIPFAKGGVIQSPVGFPMGGGRRGVAGERGAEAILPLGRSRDGRLGVVSQGGGGISVNVNISTPDVEGFRKSESQVAAAMARAVRAGQRNL